jgi:hypothetical protein
MRGGHSEERAFSAWLVQRMADQKLSGAELARMVQEHLPEGVHFTPSNISHYRSGRSAPRALVREVIEKIVSGEAVLRSKLKRQAESPAYAVDACAQEEGDISVGEKIQLEDLGSGRARILIDQQLPWAEALELIKRLKLAPGRH